MLYYIKSMPGGLMNIASQGNSNVLFTGNPTKTFFKSTYHKYTNFGMQKFRIDYKGLRHLKYKQDTVMEFKVPRYAELLADTYIVVNLPDIWSPFHFDGDNNARPYEFKWVDDIGLAMIKDIEICAGSSIISKFSGEYLHCLKERDFTTTQREKFNKMTGNITEYVNPANTDHNVNMYPNAYRFNGQTDDIEPSIRGRKLFIPLSAWFCNSMKVSLPLVAIQYQEITIKITFRPTQELYTILDVEYDDYDNTVGYLPRIAPQPNNARHQLWRFLQQPLDDKATQYQNTTRMDWRADVHLMANYVFLSNDERRVFANDTHSILTKQVYEHHHLNATGTRIIPIEGTSGMVSTYMLRFRRSDANKRNEWFNYTNWAFSNMKPQSIDLPEDFSGNAAPFANPFNYEITGPVNIENQKMILNELGIQMDGIYRENVLDQGIYNYVEKWTRCSGAAKDGLYIYNFGVKNNMFEYQPSGAMNVSKYKEVAFEYNTIEPPLAENPTHIDNICDGSGQIIAIRKNPYSLYKYNYDLCVFEERYNFVKIVSGNVGLSYAR